MAFDPNSLATKKGSLGELIFRKTFEASGYHVECLRETIGVYDVDFGCAGPDGELFYVEVKTYDSKVCDAGRYFAIADSKFDPPHLFAALNHARLFWCFVDAVTGKIYLQDESKLLQTVLIGGRKFPERINFKPADGSEPARTFHFEQFAAIGDIDADDLQELRAIDLSGGASSTYSWDAASKFLASQEPTDDTPTEPAADEPANAVARVWQSHCVLDGKNFEVWKVDGDDTAYARYGNIKRLLGFGNRTTAAESLDAAIAAAGAQIKTFQVGNNTMRPNFFDLRTLPAVLKSYREDNFTDDPRTKKYRRTQNAATLANWIREVLFVEVYGDEPPAHSQEPASEIETLIAEYERLRSASLELTLNIAAFGDKLKKITSENPTLKAPLGSCYTTNDTSRRQAS